MTKYLSIILLFIFFKTEAQPSVLKFADSLYATGNFTKAIKAYNTYNEKTEVSIKIARAYQAIGNFGQALNYYKKSSTAHPNNTLILFEYAKLLYKTKNYQQALLYFNKLADVDKENPNLHYYTGLILEKRGDSTAQAAFKKAFNLDNTHQKSIYKIARYCLKKQKHDSVTHYVLIGLKSYPDNLDLISIQAQSYYWKKEYHLAIEWFQKLIKQKESTQFIHEKLGYCYLKTYQFNKAITQLLLALELDANNTETLFVLGQLYDRIQDFKNAEKYMNRAIELLNQPLDDMFTELAIVYNKQKEYPKAIATLKQAIKENPKNLQAHFYLLMTKDKYYKDLDMKLNAFQKFNKKFPNTIHTPTVKNRISELNLEKFRAKGK
ncbi:MAG: tetratricopeptide repeat protein [Oceanihabitans sp.]